jgi:NADH-quinone oxidoreductase subunit L
VVGALTAFFAATVGLVQNDIKRVIAYSTCSQLGYMFVAAGVGFYQAAMFHLFTHAFFKALLFLGAGSVIHAMHHEQDMRKYGGLRSKIPLTYAMMLIGTLAITGVGIPLSYPRRPADRLRRLPVEGRDHRGRLGRAFRLGRVRLLAAGDRRRDDLVLQLAADLHDLPRRARATATHEHAHESPGVMLWPLAVLAPARWWRAWRSTATSSATGPRSGSASSIFTAEDNHVIHDATTCRLGEGCRPSSPCWAG